MNDIRTDLQNTSSVGQNTGGSAASDAAKVGSYRGEQVVEVPSQAALVQEAFEDSIEELTAVVGEKEEKDLSKREVQEGKKSDQLERILKLSKVDELVERLKDLSKEDLSKVVLDLLQSQTATANELRERARRHFDEPSHQHAALSALVAALKEQGAPPERIKAAEEALKRLEEEHGEAIRAGVNVSGVAAAASSQGIGDVQDLRSTYRDAVLDYQGLSQAFQSLISKYSPKQLPHAIRFIQQGLAADMAAQGSSIDKSKLNAILSDMYRLEVISTMLERSDKLIDKTRKRGARTGAVGGALLKEVLDWQNDKWLSPEKISPLPKKLRIRDIGQEILFLTDFKELVRAIPQNAFPDPDQKTRMLDGIQFCLDDAIDREEADE